MKDNERAVGVFDSGLGGLSVLAELVLRLPNENFIYYGDTANAPYGVKSVQRVRELTEDVYLKLKAEGVKAFVLACNTATSAAVSYLREKYPDDIIIGIEPALKPAVACCEHPTVAVLATPLTIREEKFLSLLERFKDSAKIIPLACPGLVEFVERGELDSEELISFLEDTLYPIKCENPDAVVLGCTHYPFVKDSIIRVLGNDVLIFDGSAGTAKETARRLEERGLKNQNNERGSVVFLDSSYIGVKNPRDSSITKFGGEFLCK